MTTKTPNLALAEDAPEPKPLALSILDWTAESYETEEGYLRRVRHQGDVIRQWMEPVLDEEGKQLRTKAGDLRWRQRIERGPRRTGESGLSDLDALVYMLTQAGADDALVRLAILRVGRKFLRQNNGVLLDASAGAAIMRLIREELPEIGEDVGPVEAVRQAMEALAGARNEAVWQCDEKHKALERKAELINTIDCLRANLSEMQQRAEKAEEALTGVKMLARAKVQREFERMHSDKVEAGWRHHHLLDDLTNHSCEWIAPHGDHSGHDLYRFMCTIAHAYGLDSDGRYVDLDALAAKIVAMQQRAEKAEEERDQALAALREQGHAEAAYDEHADWSLRTALAQRDMLLHLVIHEGSKRLRDLLDALYTPSEDPYLSSVQGALLTAAADRDEQDPDHLSASGHRRLSAMFTAFIAEVMPTVNK